MFRTILGVVVMTLSITPTQSFANDAKEIPREATYTDRLQPIEKEPPAHIIVGEPFPEQLARGRVVIPYTSYHLIIRPVYGAAALKVSPRIGHLHITVDDSPWHWLDASGEPIVITGLSAGPHRVLIELEDPTHHVIQAREVNFVIPDKLLPR